MEENSFLPLMNGKAIYKFGAPSRAYSFSGLNVKNISIKVI